MATLVVSSANGVLFVSYLVAHVEIGYNFSMFVFWSPHIRLSCSSSGRTLGSRTACVPVVEGRVVLSKAAYRAVALH